MAPRTAVTVVVSAALGAGLLAMQTGCDTGMAGGDAPASNDASEQPADAPPEAQPELVRVRVGKETFRLELAIDNDTRTLGLGGREAIAMDGGMLFVFPNPAPQAFVMRDCPIPIDIAFLDGGGRVIAMHEMLPEPPRGENEGFWEYENRLRRYPSRFAAQFAVETAGGRLAEVGLQVGDLVPIDTEGLKARAR